MFDNFKVANYNNVLLSPELYARQLSRLLTGDVIDGLTVVPGTGLQVILQPGNSLVRYGSANVASARLVSLVDTFALAITTADGSNPRNDVVVLYIDNSVTLPAAQPPTAANLDGPGVAKAIVVAGVPNANPVDPTPAAIQAAIGSSSYPYTILQRVRVDAGVNVIGPDKITDIRSMAGTAAIADGAVTPDKRSGGFYADTITLGAGVGNKPVTGFGFRPKEVRFMNANNNAAAIVYSDGFAVNTGAGVAQGFSASTGTSTARKTDTGDTAAMVISDPSTGLLFVASFVSFDADGVTINVTTDNASYRKWHVIARA